MKWLILWMIPVCQSLSPLLETGKLRGGLRSGQETGNELTPTTMEQLTAEMGEPVVDEDESQTNFPPKQEEPIALDSIGTSQKIWPLPCPTSMANLSSADGGSHHSMKLPGYYPVDRSQAILFPQCRNTSKTSLHLMGFGAIDETSAWSSAGVLPAIEMAVSDVNAREDILPGYELIVEMRDTKCDTGNAVHRLYQHLSSPPVKVAVLGGGCSGSTVPVARTIPLYGLSQVAYSASSPELARRDLYPTFFRTSMSDLGVNKPIVALCLYYNWNHVATIHEADDHFSSIFNQLHLYLNMSDITLVTSESFSVQPHGPMMNIKRKNARIIVFEGYEKSAALMFCEAYNLEMYGAKYQWIIPGWFSTKWWIKQANFTSCTADELLAAVNYSIGLIDLVGDLSGEKTFSGQTFDEYNTRYLTWPSTAEYGENSYHPNGYDAVWALALALDMADKAISSRIQVTETLPNGTTYTRPKTLADFQYETEFEMSAEIWKAISRVAFHGVSGYLKFNLGERNALIELQQITENDTERFAVFYEDNLELDMLDEPMWHGSGPPISWPATLFITIYKNRVLAICMSAISVIGVLAAVFVLGFNIKYKGHLYIKMSSPNLNNLIVFGCALAYCTVVLHALDTQFIDAQAMDNVCVAREWVMAISFTFSFGAMFAKTLRVHRIFTRLAIANTPVHDRHLLGLVGILLCLDVFILTIWVAIDPLHLSIKNTTVYELDDAVLIYQNEDCTCQYVWYWSGSLLLVKGLLLVFGCFLAFETRKVSIPGLNDSKYIGLCVYNVVVMCLVGNTICLLLTDKETVSFGFLSLCVLFSTTTTISLLFIPKLLYVRKHPELTEANRRQARLAGGKAATRTSSNTFQFSMKHVCKSTESIKMNGSLTELDEILSNDVGSILAEKDRQIASLKRQYRTLEERSEEVERNHLALEKSLSDAQTKPAKIFSISD